MEQNYEMKRQKIVDRFNRMKQENPKALEGKLNLSWSNWGFGLESLSNSASRLQKAGLEYIELHGNHYGADLGYKPAETLDIIKSYGLKVSGVCGMFSCDNDLSSNRPLNRQAAIDYLKREIEFTAAVGGEYLLVVPAAVGRAQPYDDSEFERSVEAIQTVSELFVKYNVKAAIEPIRSAETSLTHTFEDAKRYIAAVDRPNISYINGDVYHMQLEESHIGEAIVNAGDMLVNLHMADSNRCALGSGSLDLDCIIMALYLISYNKSGRFITPEPLGPGGDPYPAMNGKPDSVILDNLVNDTVLYFNQRVEKLLSY